MGAVRLLFGLLTLLLHDEVRAQSLSTFYIIGATSDNQNYAFEELGLDPTIQVPRGGILRFTFRQPLPAHALYIRTALALSGQPLANLYPNAVTGQGSVSGSFDIPIPIDEPRSEIYYQCGDHPEMNGRIVLFGGVSGSPVPQTVPQAARTTYTISGGDTFDYLFEGLGRDPQLYVLRGTDIRIELRDVTGYPLWIRRRAATTPDNSETNAYENVVNNGAREGTIIIRIPSTETLSSLVYQCAFHPAMVGTIILGDASTPFLYPSLAGLPSPSVPRGPPKDTKVPGSSVAAIITLSITTGILACSLVFGIFAVCCVLSKEPEEKERDEEMATRTVPIAHTVITPGYTHERFVNVDVPEGGLTYDGALLSSPGSLSPERIVNGRRVSFR